VAKPLPLPVWDRQAGKLIEEFMDDHPSAYESRPRRSFNQWLESEPLYDWLLAAYQNTRRSARQIEPFIRKHTIDIASSIRLSISRSPSSSTGSFGQALGE
jgi:phosphatidylserine decarboxylase